ncbi:hypothetical protein BC938DRAFT_483863 [Jimgerdemannia flammicorona]|uniref:RRM domain-containing protein n=1 Tax=Jimgerdemannia flammicorona TaxID=994334 RepID=A0A433QB29_9FUNG|nr:hypothetical protein BC938DRAFT_483863 [Jimgerdemannia flammicorona]
MAESAIPTKPKAPIQHLNEPLVKRAYIGGLDSSVAVADLENRFRSFGNVSNVDVARNAETGLCRGFAYITINTTIGQWKKCTYEPSHLPFESINLLNGAKWKGMEMKIEDAKPDYRERMQKEWDVQREKEANPSKKRKRVLCDGVLAKDMTPVTDKNMDGRKNWKRGRYGRAISMMHLRKDNGTRFVYDPTHYKNNLLKIYNLGVKMKSVRRLSMYYEDFEKESNTGYDYANESDETPENESRDGMVAGDGALKRQTPSRIIGATKPGSKEPTVMKEISNQRRLEALRKRQEERHAEQKRMSVELINVDVTVPNDGHIKFGESDENDNVSDDEEEEDGDSDSTKPMYKPAKQVLKIMFDSDEEDSDQPGFGEAGRNRLNLQKRFGGDTRFKLNEDFMDEDERLARSAHKPLFGTSEDDVAKELTEEKLRATDVLNAMFGKEKNKVFKEKSRQPAWSQAARFDPDAAGAEDLLLWSDKNEDQTSGEQVAAEESLSSHIAVIESRSSKQPSHNSSTTPVPEVSKEKHFNININLKPLFTPGVDTGTFKLFDGDDEESEPEEEEPAKEVAAPIMQIFNPVLVRITESIPSTRNDLWAATAGNFGAIFLPFRRAESAKEIKLQERPDIHADSDNGGDHIDMGIGTQGSDR